MSIHWKRPTKKAKALSIALAGGGSSHHGGGVHSGSRHSRHSLHSGVFHSADLSDSDEFAQDTENAALAQDKVEVVVPAASMRRNTLNKMSQFCQEKIVQSQKRLTKLYGREKEIQLLRNEFDSVCNSSGSDDKSYRSLVLISGMSGEGKTALALQLQKMAEKKRSNGRRPIFVLGKYQVSTLGEPYSGIKAALEDLCREITSFPSEALKQIRQDVREKMSWEIDLLSQVIPELSVLKSGGRQTTATKASAPEESQAMEQPQANPSNTSSTKRGVLTSLRSSISKSRRSIKNLRDGSMKNQSQRSISNLQQQGEHKFEAGAGGADRLRFALRKLVNVVSSFAPLIFVCDDAQWAGKADMSLLQAWITDEANQSLLLVWTYRKNMVGPDHQVSKSIKEIEAIQEERSIDSIRTIDVGELQEADVGEMIADTLDVSPDKSDELAKIIYNKTLGNVFFVRQYLLSLAQKGLLTFNMARMAWDWDADAIRAGSTATDNVVGLMKEKLQESPLACKILPLAALLGATFDTRVLDEVIAGMKKAEETEEHLTATIFSQVLGSEYSRDLDTEQLEEIEKEGLIEEAGASCYAFIHDKVIEGSLALVPDDQLDNLRFGMGLVLFERLKPVKDRWAEESAFLLVNLLNAGLDSIPQDQKLAVCLLNMEAGDKAFMAAAYSRSADYYGAAIKLLPEDHWASMYDTSLHLFHAAAESEMCLGNYEQMESYARSLLERDCPVLDKLPMYQVLVSAHAIKAELQEAWYLNDDVLRKVGFKFSKKRLKARTKAAIMSMKLMKKKWKPDALAHLPVTEDPVDEAISQMSDIFIIAVQAVIPDGFHLAIIAQCKHILERGLNRYAAVPLAWLGLVITNILGDLQWAKEHAEFTHSLLSRLPNRRIETRVNMVTNIFMLHWTAPIHNSIKPLINAYSRGMECCDMDSGFWCAQFYHESSLYSGKDLALLQKDAEVYCKQEKDYGMLKHLECLQSVLQLILNLRGLSDNTTVLTGTAHDQAAALEMLEKTPDFHHLSHIQKDRLSAAAIFGDFEHGANLGMANIDMICHVISGQHSTVMSRFVLGLCCFVMAKTNKKKYLKSALQNLKVMQTWFEKGNPNAQHYLLFLKAEKARLEGKKDKALSFYDRAVLLAGRSGYNHDRALACERLAEYYVELGDKASAKNQFQDSLQLYQEWGALKKVDLLSGRVQSLQLD